MDINKYKIVLAVIDRGSLASICEEVGYTQSGLTQMMNSVERELGFNLFLRSNKGIQLTPEGEGALPYIRELVQVNEAAEQQFARIRGLETGRVRVGAYHSIACVWLPKILRNFRVLHPNIEVDVLEEHSAKQMERSIQRGQMDLCFVSKHSYHTFDWIDLRMDQYMAVLPACHPLASEGHLSPDMLANDTLFLCRSLDGIDPDLVYYLDNCHIPVKSRNFCNSDNTILAMVEEGLGVSILPKLALEEFWHGQRNIAVLPLYPQGYRRLGIGVNGKKKMSLATKEFIQCTKSTLSQLP